MNDKELIIKAAKAIGLEGCWVDEWTFGDSSLVVGGYDYNPLTNPHDAFTLQTELYMRVFINKEDSTTTALVGNMSSDVSGYALEHHKGDVLKATMRAIVRCAADTVRED